MISVRELRNFFNGVLDDYKCAFLVGEQDARLLCIHDVWEMTGCRKVVFEDADEDTEPETTAAQIWSTITAGLGEYDMIQFEYNDKFGTIVGQDIEHSSRYLLLEFESYTD